MTDAITSSARSTVTDVGSARGSATDALSASALEAWKQALADGGARQGASGDVGGWGDLSSRPSASTRDRAGDIRPAQARESVPGPGPVRSPFPPGPGLMLPWLAGAFDAAPSRSEGKVPGAANLDWVVDRDAGTLNFYQRHADASRTLVRSLQVQGERVLTPDGQVVGRSRADGGFELDRIDLDDLRRCAPPEGAVPAQPGFSQTPPVPHNPGLAPPPPSTSTEPGEGGFSPAPTRPNTLVTTPADLELPDVFETAHVDLGPVTPQEVQEAAGYGRSVADYRALVLDPDQGGNATQKSLRERDVILHQESTGAIPGPVVRGPAGQTGGGGADYKDATGQLWDIKGFWSNPNPAQPGSFNAATAANKIDRELARGANVVVDTAKMTGADVQALRTEARLRGWGARVLWS